MRIVEKLGVITCVLMLVTMIGCKEEEAPQPKYTAFIYDYQSFLIGDFTTVTVEAKITNIGDGGIQDYGFVWGKLKDVDVTFTGKKSFGATNDTATIRYTIPNLEPKQVYYVSFFVEDQLGLRYSEEKQVRTIQSPIVTSLNIKEGSFGDTLDISGVSFSSIADENIIKLGSIEVPVLSSQGVVNPTIKCLIPKGLTVGQEYNVDVSVRGIQATSDQKFTYLSGANWTQKKSFSGVARMFSTSFTVNNKAYLGLGTTEYTDRAAKALNDIWEYDPSIDTWTQKANFPGEKRYGAVAFTIFDVAFVGLGGAESGRKQDFWQYKPATNSWSLMGDMPEQISGFAFATGGKGYVVNTRNMELWQIDFGVWGKQKTLPFSASGARFVINDVVYLLDTSKNLWKYASSTDSWTKLGVFPGAYNYNKGLVINGKGYLFGRADDNYAAWEYDPANDSWRKKRGLASVFRTPDYRHTFSIGSKGYIRHSNMDRSTFWEFEPTE